MLARARGTWLLLLIVAAALTVNVLQAFESTLEQVVTLAVFIPLLIGTGGNSGAQAATSVVRAMALGEVRIKDLPRILRRELMVGLLLGLILGAIAFPIVGLVFGWSFAAVVVDAARDLLVGIVRRRSAPRPRPSGRHRPGRGVRSADHDAGGRVRADHLLPDRARAARPLRPPRARTASVIPDAGGRGRSPSLR
jgi:hypothetical protein